MRLFVRYRRMYREGCRARRFSLNTLLLGSWLFIFSPAGWADDKVPVFVSIAPQKTFVHQIGKPWVDIRVMVEPGASPATYEPKPRQMADLSKTVVYFAIGVPFENAWMRRITAANPTMAVIRTDRGIEKIPTANHHDEDHGKHSPEEDHHRHGELDPHIWLSPPLVIAQARTILEALQQVDPTHRADYEKNYQAFVSDIVKLHMELKDTFQNHHGLQFMVYHPSWGYFAHTYGLEQVPIEIEGKNPKPAQLKALIEHAREKGIKVIFVQPQFPTKNAALVAGEIGGQVTYADPLAEDWFGNLREVAKKFKAALR